MALNADVLRFMVSFLAEASALEASNTTASNSETPFHLLSQVVRLRRVCKCWNRALAFTTVNVFFEVIHNSLSRVSFYLGDGALPPPLWYLPLYHYWRNKYRWWMDTIAMTEIIELLKGKETWYIPASCPINNQPCISRHTHEEEGAWGNPLISLHLGNLNLPPPNAFSEEAMLDQLLPYLVVTVFRIGLLTEIDSFDRLLGVYLLEDKCTFLCYLMDSGDGAVQEPDNICLTVYEPSKLVCVGFHSELKFSVLCDYYSDWEFSLARRLEGYVEAQARRAVRLGA